MPKYGVKWLCQYNQYTRIYLCFKIHLSVRDHFLYPKDKDRGDLRVKTTYSLSELFILQKYQPVSRPTPGTCQGASIRPLKDPPGLFCGFCDGTTNLQTLRLLLHCDRFSDYIYQPLNFSSFTAVKQFSVHFSKLFIVVNV